MKKFTYFIFIAVPLLVFAWDTYQKTGYSADDTFIYMQYGRHIAAGDGFTFNPGEPSYGVTSPLWAILVSTSYFLELDGFWSAKFLDLFFALFAAFVFFGLTKFFFKENQLLRYTAAAMFILNPWFIRWSFTGMETSFAVFLAVWVFSLFYSKNYGLMFFVLGLMYLTRPESALLTAILFAVLLYRQVKENNFRIRDAGKYVLLFCLPVVPFLIYAKSNFGTILPNTALGKSTLSLSAAVIFNQLKEIFTTLAGASIIEMALSGVFIIIAIRKKDFGGTLPLLFWVAGLITLYIVTDADIISRYLLIISPFFILIGLKSLEYLPKMQSAAVVVVFIISLFFSQFIFYKFVKPSTDDFTAGVNECLIPLGKWLSENTPGNSKILVNDVGAVGYYADRYIIDAAALINSDLELNKRIMAAPLEERLFTHKLLKYIAADYVVERDTSEANTLTSFDKYSLELKTSRKFPSLGISDTTPRYYKIYKVTKLFK